MAATTHATQPPEHASDELCFVTIGAQNEPGSWKIIDRWGEFLICQAENKFTGVDASGDGQLELRWRVAATISIDDERESHFLAMAIGTMNTLIAAQATRDLGRSIASAVASR